MRLGSLTQAVRQPTRFGANLWPMCGQGFARLDSMGREFVHGPTLKWGETLDALGSYRPAPVILSLPRFLGIYTITGVTRDNNANVVGSATVYVFKADARNEFVAQTTSDVSGNYTAVLSQNSDNFWAVAYKVGPPDITGATIRSLTAV